MVITCYVLIAHSTGQEYRQSVGSTFLKHFLGMIRQTNHIPLQVTISETAPELLKYFCPCFEDHQTTELIDTCLTNISDLVVHENYVIRCSVVVIHHTIAHARHVFISAFHALSKLNNYFVEWQNKDDDFKTLAVFKTIPIIFQILKNVKISENNDIFRVLISSQSISFLHEYHNVIQLDFTKIYNSQSLCYINTLAHIIKILFSGLLFRNKHIVDLSLDSISNLLKLNYPTIRRLFIDPHLLSDIFHQICDNDRQVININHFDFFSQGLCFFYPDTFPVSCSSSLNVIPLSPPETLRLDIDRVTDDFLLPDDMEQTLPNSTLLNQLSEDQFESFCDIDEVTKSKSHNYFRQKIGELLNGVSKDPPINILTPFIMSLIFGYDDRHAVYESLFPITTQIHAIDHLSNILPIYPVIISEKFSISGNVQYKLHDVFEIITSDLDPQFFGSLLTLASVYIVLCSKSILASSGFDLNKFLLDISSISNENAQILSSKFKFFSKTANLLLFEPNCNKFVVEFIHSALNTSLNDKPIVKSELLEFYSFLNFRLLEEISTKFKNSNAVMMRRDLQSLIFNEIVRMVGFEDVRVRRSAILALIKNIMNFKLTSESRIESMSKLLEIGIDRDDNNAFIPTKDWLFSSLSAIISYVIRVISTNENRTNFLHCLAEISLHYSPILVPECWGIKHIGSWGINQTDSNITTFVMLFEVVTTNELVCSNLTLMTSLLKLAAECLGGCFIAEDINLPILCLPSQYDGYWRRIFNYTLNILQFITSTMYDDDFIESQKSKLLEHDFFIGFGKVGDVNFTKISPHITEIVQNQIKLSYEAHMFSLSKYENDKFTQITVTVLHTMELLIKCSTFNLVANHFLHLYLNLLCLINRFPLLSTLCIKQLIFLFVEHSKWFALYRSNDTSDFYTDDPLFTEDPEFSTLLKVKCRAIKYINTPFSSASGILSHTTLKLVDHPLVSCDKYNTPSLSVFSYFVTIGFKLFFGHYSMVFHALMLDIVELLICMQVNYITLDPGSAFLQLTYTKYNNVLKTPHRISGYFVQRLFRFWCLFHKLFIADEELLGEEWQEALRLTRMSSLITLATVQIQDQTCNPPSNVLSIFDVLLNEQIFSNRITCSTNSTIQDSNVEQLFIILFEKYQDHLKNYILIKNIVENLCRIENADFEVVSFIPSILFRMIEKDLIPLERFDFYVSISELFEKFAFTSLEYFNEIEFYVSHPNLFKDLLAPTINLRRFSSILLIFHVFTDFPCGNSKTFNLPESISKALDGSTQVQQVTLLDHELLIFQCLLSQFIKNQLLCHQTNHILRVFTAIFKKIKNQLLIFQPICHHNICTFLIRVINFKDITYLLNTRLFLDYFELQLLLNHYCSNWRCVMNTDSFDSSSLIYQSYELQILCSIYKFNIFTRCHPFKILFTEIYENLFNQDSTYLEKIKKLHLQIQNESYIAQLLDFVNDKSFDPFRFPGFLQNIKLLIPDVFHVIIPHIENIKWLHLAEFLPVIIELDQMLQTKSRTDNLCFESVSKYINPRFKISYKYAQKLKVKIDSLFEPNLINVLSHNECFIDEIKILFAVIERSNPETLKNFFSRFELQSYHLAYQLINHYLPVLTANRVDQNSPLFSLVDANIWQAVEWAYTPINNLIKTVVSDSETLYDQSTDGGYNFNGLIKDIKKTPCDLIHIGKCLQVLLFSETILKMINKYLIVDKREIYIFSLVISSTFPEPSEYLNAILCYINITSLCLRVPSLLQDNHNFVIYLLCRCITNIFEYFAKVTYNFDPFISLKLYRELFHDYKSSYLQLALCQLNYTSRFIGRLHFQTHESCSLSKLEFDQNFSYLSFMLYSFIYNVSRHPVFSNFTRTPYPLIRDIAELTSDYQPGHVLNISFIPMESISCKKDIKQLIVGFLKLGWVNTQFYMECIMLLLSLLNSDLPEHEIRSNVPKLRTQICRAIVQMVHYVASSPLAGDPMFSDALQQPSNINSLRSCENSQSISVFTFYTIFKYWRNVCNIQNILLPPWPKGTEASKIKTPSLNDTILYSFNSFITRENQKKCSPNDNNPDNNQLDTKEAFLEIVPIIKPLAEFMLNSIHISNPDYGDSIHKHKIVSQLAILVKFISEDYERLQILETMCRYSKTPFPNDSTFLRYSIILIAQSMNHFPGHSSHKYFLSLVRSATNYPHDISVQISLLVSLIEISQSNKNTEHFQPIFTSFIAVLVDIFKDASFVIKNIIIHLFWVAMHSSPDSPLSHTISSQFIDKILPCTDTYQLKNIDTPLYHRLYLCARMITLNGKHGQRLIRSLTLPTESKHSKSILEILKMDIIVSELSKKEANFSAFELMEIAAHLMQKMLSQDLVICFKLSNLLLFILSQFDDVENLLNKIINIICASDSSKLRPFLDTLFQCIKRLDSYRMERFNNIWLLHTLNILKKQKHKISEIHLNQILATFCRPPSEKLYKATIVAELNAGLEEQLRSNLQARIINLLENENEKIEFKESLHELL
ncbi:hypothetical protein RF11_11490 [Thelohanellus kitauei]|uniref:Uncharacterized protein n=1 Tax=Thelohanellus kitauei TaxID=669202 RepID=A0A0C2JQN7_THEKT|nr:hypothetical protein RF11_11490 [Thelohanellus kitauei]